MPLQSSGEINISQIRTEMGFNSGSNASATHPTSILSNNRSDSNYVASSSSNSGNAWRLFDNATRWDSASGVYSDINYIGSVTTNVGGSSVAGEWIQLEFMNGITNISSVVYTGTGLQANFGQIVVCASNNQTTFTQLLATGHGYIEGTYNISSNKSYRYVRTICLKKFQGGNTFCTINEWKINGIIGNSDQIEIATFQGLTGGQISFNDFYGKDNIMTFYNWYTLFNRINSNFTIAQSGSNPDVQLQMNSTSTGSSGTTLWYDTKIQTSSRFVAEFEIFMSDGADGSSFNVGFNSTAGLFGEGPNAPAFCLTFHVWQSRADGIYLFDSSGNQVGFYNYAVGENVWRKVRVIYNRSTTNTWQIFFNGINIINYNNPNNETWVTNTSGNIFGFGSRTGGVTHNFYVRRFALTLN
jgi:hypothetical protein